MEQTLSARLILGEGGRMVIPAAFRKALGFKVGDEIIARIEDGELRLIQQMQALQNVQNFLQQLPAPKRGSHTDHFLSLRHEDGE